MTKEQKDKLKTKILEQIDETTAAIEELKELTQPIAPDCSIGRVSRMDAINNKAVNEAALLKAESKLSKLQYALSKIDEADFGKCSVCGNDIQEGRLLLLPESRKCVHCAARG